MAAIKSPNTQEIASGGSVMHTKSVSRENVALQSNALIKSAYKTSALLQTLLEMTSSSSFVLRQLFLPSCLAFFPRLQLMPLLQDLTGGASALDTRLDELSRQSRLAREMVQSEAEHWEDQHYVSADPDLDNREQSELRWRENGLSAGRRLDLFPVLPFLRGDKEGAGERGRERPLPEFVREELLHRFVTGALFADVRHTTARSTMFSHEIRSLGLSPVFVESSVPLSIYCSR